MKKITDKDLQKIYFGWLGKAIGVRYGAPVEMWESSEIIKKYGDVEGYFEEYNDFAADDDTNGPIFFYRALRDCKELDKYGFEDLADCWMNYVPFEHGFYWWGGYGVSEEHTAYLNILNGIMPPHCGSILQNGKVMAEQIGGQIFSDVWGLVAPHNIKLAASLAKKASQVSHDGVAVDGGVFVASMISAAFDSSSIKEIINKALEMIDENSGYALMIKDLIRVYEKGYSQEESFQHIKENYWKDKYGGNCHIIPNAAIMIYSLLYGQGDFIKTLKIANYSGFDTDCNVGNLGTIMGVFTSLKNVDYQTWIAPIKDLTLCSSVLGYSNIVSIPLFAYDLFKTALRLENQTYDGIYNNCLKFDIDDLHLDFMLLNSTSGIRSDNTTFINEDKVLKIKVKPNIDNKIYYKTYYGKKDLADNRYDPCFSPKVYNGQTIYANYKKNENVKVYIFYEDLHENKIYKSNANETSLKIKANKDSLIGKIGLIINSNKDDVLELISLDCNGKVDYMIDFSKETMEDYSLYHQEVSQCTYYKGIWKLENNVLTGRCLDNGQLLTSKPIKDFVIDTSINLQSGNNAGVLFKVLGVRRQYQLLFEKGKIKLIKNYKHKNTLVEKDFQIKNNLKYNISISVIDKKILIYVDDKLTIEYVDENIIEKGCVGFYVDNGSVLSVDKIKIKEY